jgi:phosphoribosyl 1,2-cyclic phosphate phosphodiesterase
MADLTITFLGTGTSQGVPMIGCDCPVCLSGDARDKRLRSSIYIETPEAAWVVDTGPEFRLQCLRAGVRRMDAAVYTHGHTDHIMGFDDLRRFCGEGRGMPIYAGQETMDDLKRIFDFAFNGRNLFPGYVQPLPKVVNPFEPFQIGATTLTPLPLQHGRAVVFGYLLERNGRALAAYLSDCKETSAAVEERIRGVGVLIVDALRHRPHNTHMNVAEALAFVERVRPGAAWFTHLCHELGHAETEAGLPAGVRIAYDGLRLEP